MIVVGILAVLVVFFVLRRRARTRAMAAPVTMWVPRVDAYRQGRSKIRRGF